VGGTAAAVGVAGTGCEPSRRSFATRRKTKAQRLAPEILDNLPSYEEVDVPVPKDEPAYYRRKPVSSAHLVDVRKQQISKLDSVAVGPDGSVVHGKYGNLGSDSAASVIPLEYLALLGPAAEGAAAVRTVLSKSKNAAWGTGTLLVYGASEANGFAATQLASSAGHAVVGVVGANHAGNESLMESLKGLIEEPGTAVPEEYALSKKNFAELVQGISTGNEGIAATPADAYLNDFKKNFLDYVEAYPDTRPAAVSEEHLEFKYMEKDREFWEYNMQAFLEQYPPGAPPVDKSQLDASFTTEQYEIFRQKFWKQTSSVISGDDGGAQFSPPHIVKRQCEQRESLDGSGGATSTEFPFAFSVLNQKFPEGTEAKAGGPIVGAIVVATPTLTAAAEKVAAAKTLRAKGEALQFLTSSQKSAFGAASSVANLARKAGAPVVTIGGSLRGIDSVGDPTEADVKEALSAMDIDEAGESRLNYFVQVYRASDFPFYADYAVHRASEELAGPRQIVVTK